MSITLRQATRKKSRLKIGLTAPSGCGKTFSGLLLASGITGGDWSKVAVIDTENSADKYADHPSLGSFQLINLNDPCSDPDRFNPLRYIAAMNSCVEAGIEAIVIDSATHEWIWCLEYQSRLGGRFQDWKKVTPLHDRFIQAILGCNAHVIVCTRRKTDYGVNIEGGKTIVTKVGLKSEIREGFEYELDIVWGLNQSHMAEVEKDRTGIFTSRPSFVITQSTGADLLAWANGASA